MGGPFPASVQTAPKVGGGPGRGKEAPKDRGEQCLAGPLGPLQLAQPSLLFHPPDNGLSAAPKQGAGLPCDEVPQ